MRIPPLDPPHETQRPLRPLLLVLALIALGALASCANVIDFLPKEIQDAEKSSIEGARALQAESPEAFHAYTADGRAVRYVELKQDEPPRPLVIFVHGSPGLWRSWMPYLADSELRGRANLIAMDRPGFGGSGSGQIERSLLKQSEAIAPLLQHRQPGQRVVLVGHAYGAALAARIAMQFPEQVTDLVLTAAPLDPKLQSESWFQYLADWPPITWLLPPEIVVFNREYLGLERELSELLPLWGTVTQRVSLLLGVDDEEVLIATADFAEKRLTAARSVEVIRLAHTNHFIPWTRFGQVKARILAHLQP